MPYFEARQIYKQYSNQLALHNVSIDVPQASVYGLLGPNGAGKTTLIRIINRITAPDSGEIFFRHHPFADSDMAALGYLPEERGLYKKMKVGEQALYLARLKGLSRHDAIHKLKYWFDKFEMVNWWDKKIEELSKGMAQKVQFITTILHDPELIILDEPFSGFDPVNASMLKKEVLALKKEGKTIILSTHDMSSVEELCDNISLINKAETVLQGKVTDIRQQFKKNRFELVFSGSSDELSRQLQGHCQIEASGIREDGNAYLLIQLPSGHQGNEILRYALELVPIHVFREVLPSMNEVFIQAVKQPQPFSI